MRNEDLATEFDRLTAAFIGAGPETSKPALHELEDFIMENRQDIAKALKLISCREREQEPQL